MPDCNWVDTPLVIHNRADLPRLVPVSRSNQNPLPRLPAGWDNATMQTEPPKAISPKRKRRWFQFSLRTLMIVVTLLAGACAYFARSIEIARTRSAMLDQIRDVDQGNVIRYGHREDGLVPPDKPDDRFAVPWHRRLFGDDAIATILLPLATDRKHLSEIHAMFPEAKIGAFTETSPTSIRHFIKFFDFPDDSAPTPLNTSQR